MIIRNIKIELQLEDGDDLNHATQLEFKNNMWTINGSMYPRIASALNEIFNLLKGRKS